MNSSKINQSYNIQDLNLKDYNKHFDMMPSTTSLENLYINKKPDNLKKSGSPSPPPPPPPLNGINMQMQSKSELKNKTNEFLKRTNDILVEALRSDLEERKDIFDNTVLDNDYKKYNIDDNNKIENNIGDKNKAMMALPPGVLTDADGLIIPKKLINPCLESIDRRDLNRELRFNQKIGKNVLNQKSELQRALEKQKEKHIIQNQTVQNNEGGGLRNELNRAVMERAQKNEKKQLLSNQDNTDSHVNAEYLNARAKLRTRIDTK